MSKTEISAAKLSYHTRAHKTRPPSVIMGLSHTATVTSCVNSRTTHTTIAQATRERLAPFCSRRHEISVEGEHSARLCSRRYGLSAGRERSAPFCSRKGHFDAKRERTIVCALPLQFFYRGNGAKGSALLPRIPKFPIAGALGTALLPKAGEARFEYEQASYIMHCMSGIWSTQFNRFHNHADQNHGIYRLLPFPATN